MANSLTRGRGRSSISFAEGQRLGLFSRSRPFRTATPAAASRYIRSELLEAVFPVSVVVTLAICKKINDFLDFAVLDHPPQTDSVHVMERYHDLQAAGLDLQQIEFFHSFADSPAADLFDNSNAMIGIDDLIAYVEITVGADHEGTPTRTGHLRNCTLLVYPSRARKAIHRQTSD